jgi:hypothetical protein
VFDEMTARNYFVIIERSLLRWDVDDYNNTRGAFLGLVLSSFKIPKNGAPNVS